MLVIYKLSEGTMLAVIAILAGSFAGLIGLTFLANLIVACSVYQTAYRDEPVVLQRGTESFPPPGPALERQRAGRFDPPLTIALATGTSSALAPGDDALLPQA